MANKNEIEINLKATGGTSAASEVREVEIAIEDLGTSSTSLGNSTVSLDEVQESLSARFAESRRRLDEYNESLKQVEGKPSGGGVKGLYLDFKKLGRSLSGAFGVSITKLSALAGGPVALILAAGAAGIATARKIIAYFDRINEAAGIALPEIARNSADAKVQADALRRSQEILADSLAKVNALADAYSAKLKQIADDQAALVEADLGAELANIDLAEQLGNFDPQQADDARAAARRLAAERKRETERQRLEKEASDRRQVEEQARQNLRNTEPAAREAQAELDQLRRQGPQRAAGLEDLQEQNRRAMEALANAPQDPEEIRRLSEALQAARQELVEAYEASVEDALEKRAEALAATAAARENLAGSTQARENAEAELNRFNTTGQAQFDAQEREAATRKRIADLQRERESAAAAEQDRKAQEDARLQESLTASQGLAERIRGSIEGKTGGGGQAEAVRAKLETVAQLLADGTNTGELEVIAQILDQLQEIAGIQQSAKQTIAGFAAQMKTLESQIKAAR